MLPIALVLALQPAELQKLLNKYLRRKKL